MGKNHCLAQNTPLVSGRVTNRDKKGEALVPGGT
jgi:hypothetical protein